MNDCFLARFEISEIIKIKIKSKNLMKSSFGEQERRSPKESTAVATPNLSLSIRLRAEQRTHQKKFA
jgi:hypothetical protein